MDTSHTHTHTTCQEDLPERVEYVHLFTDVVRMLLLCVNGCVWVRVCLCWGVHLMEA